MAVSKAGTHNTAVLAEQKIALSGKEVAAKVQTFKQNGYKL